MVKIKAGKYYRTREGEKVGPMIRHGSGWTTPEHGNAWYQDGTQPLDPNGSGPDAIISEWSDFDPNWPHGHVTRSGLKARIICTDRVGDEPIVVLVGNDDTVLPARCDGTNPHGISDCDLINAPAPKREFWVNVYPGRAVVYETQEEAYMRASAGRIACAHVTEGDGL